MENDKAKKLLIVVLLILLLACLGFVVWQYIQLNRNSSVEVKEDTTIEKQNAQLKEEIKILKATITIKDNEISNLKLQKEDYTIFNIDLDRHQVEIYFHVYLEGFTIKI